MKKVIFKEVLKQLWFYIISYFSHYLFPLIKESFEKAKNYFISLIWEAVKDEFTAHVKSTVEFIEHLFDSPDYKEKEKAVIDTLFKNVNLPLFLKPFKPLLKKILKKKLHKLVEKYLKKLDAKF